MVDRRSGEGFMSQVRGNASSVLQLLAQWEEYDKELESTKESIKKQILELKEKEERLKVAEERERKFEDSMVERLWVLHKKEKESDRKQLLEANLIRVAIEAQNEEVVTQLKAQEDSLVKKHEELMREVEAREEALRLREVGFQQRQNTEAKEIEEKKKFLEVKEKELEELMRDVEARQEAVSLREVEFQQRQNAEAKDIEEKKKFLERNEKELEEKMKDLTLRQRELEEQRSIEAAVCRKRSRLDFELSLLAEKGSDTDSVIPPGIKHKPIGEQNMNDEEKTSSGSATEHTNEGKGREIVEINCEDPDEFNNTLMSTSEAKGREVGAIVCIDEDPEPIDCPDPDFNDFSKTINSFAKSQVWALYDPADAMPRYYALIESVSKRKQSVRVTWLESVHNLANEKLIPIACGRFKHGALETKSLLVFSHKMHRTILGKNVTIDPRIGETWALFRDWTEAWNTDREQHKPPYRYDIVEVETEFHSVHGIGVAYLGRVEGFTSVYQQAEQHGVIKTMISPDKMFRFSHRVPSFRLTGDETEGVPAGSFELDPAALPRGLFAVRNEEAMVLV